MSHSTASLRRLWRLLIAPRHTTACCAGGGTVRWANFR